MITKTTETKTLDEHIISRDEAIELGMGKLTTPYKKEEEWMLINTINDMRVSNITYGLIKTKAGIEVWRTGMKTIDE